MSSSRVGETPLKCWREVIGDTFQAAVNPPIVTEVYGKSKSGPESDFLGYAFFIPSDHETKRRPFYESRFHELPLDLDRHMRKAYKEYLGILNGHRGRVLAEGGAEVSR